MNREHRKTDYKITILLLLIAGAAIGIGIFRGEVISVLNKAIRICLECIGVG